MPPTTSFDGLEYHVNQDQPHQELVIVHDTMDDEGGLDGSSIEGGRYVMPGIRHVIADTRMKITELDPIHMDLSQEPEPAKGETACYLKPIVRHAKIGADRVHDAFMQSKKVLCLGGNHVRALDVLGALRACHEMGIKMGIIWVDAHPDLNNRKSTVTGHMHGMGAAEVLGRGSTKELLDLLNGAPYIDPHDFVYIGINAIDNPRNEDGSEREHTELKYLRELKEKGVKCFTMEDMKDDRKRGLVPDEVKNAVAELSDRLKKDGGKLWVEWDVDSVDKKDMPAAVMDNEDGMSGEQIHDLFRHLGTRCEIDGVGVSELDPKKDIDGKSTKLVAEAVGHLFGVNNPTYSVHMDRSRKEMKGDKTEIGASVQHAAKPVTKGVARRVRDILTGLAGGMLVMLAVDQTDKQTSAPKEPEVTATSHSGDRMTSHFLQSFSGSDFLATSARLRSMVDNNDGKGIDDCMNELVQKYVVERKRAPTTQAAWALGELTLSEFTRGFSLGMMAGSNELKHYYQVFTERVREEEKA